MAPPAAPLAGRFTHPWLAPLPAGRARIYDIAYKTVATALVAFSAFAFFEVGRGTYYVMNSNRMRQQKEAEAVRQTASPSGAPGGAAGEPGSPAAAPGAPPPAAAPLPWRVEWQLRGTATAAATAAATPPPQADRGRQPGPSSPRPPPPPPLQPPPATQLSWTVFDRGASVRAAALAAAGWAPADFDARFADLAALLPDLPRALPSLAPAQLLAALADPEAVGTKIVTLKAALPGTNVGVLLLMHPALLEAACAPGALAEGVEHAARVLGGRAVAEEVLQWYPPLIEPGVLDGAVAQLRRLVPRLAERCLPPSPGAGAGARAAVKGGAEAGQGGGG
ncbi:hypothetical protein TSOC_002156, partial [Tetrabaena socialis]